jgi:hypothetical protein
MTTTAEMTAHAAKLRCNFQDGMSAFESAETEAAATRAKALYRVAMAHHEAGHGVVGVALGALALRAARWAERRGRPGAWWTRQCVMIVVRTPVSSFVFPSISLSL